MKFKFKPVLFIIINHLALSFCKRYDNFTLFSTTPQTKDQLKFLSSIENIQNIELVFWKRPHKVYVECQFLVNPCHKKIFLERALHFGLNITEQNQNIQREFDDQLISHKHVIRSKNFTWDHYSSLEDIYQWIQDIATKYPNKLTVEKIGTSVGDQQIFAVCFTKPDASPKRKIFVDAGIHGNEWMAVAFVLYLINQLINETGELHELLQKYDWYLVPIVNPDGYLYSFTSDPLWKKNTNKKYSNVSMGVNLNRNFDYNFGKLRRDIKNKVEDLVRVTRNQWIQAANCQSMWPLLSSRRFSADNDKHRKRINYEEYSSSSDPGDEEYCGPYPFSEPETKVLADFLMYIKKKQNLMYYFSFHAYGQHIIIPYSDRINHLENYSLLENYGQQAIVRMFKNHGTKYSVGNAYDTIGKRISGSSGDWVMKELKVPYVFTILLRDTGKYGYGLPANQIIPTCKEATDGLIQLVTSRPRQMRSNLFDHSTAVKLNLNLMIFCMIYILKYIFV